jgi:transglutaminase-like putative cysteine protease
VTATLLDRLREANRTPVVENSVALRVAVFVAVMIATHGALRLGIGGPLLEVACYVGIPAGYLLSHRLRHHSRGWLKALLAIGAIGAFAQFVGLLAPAFGGQVFGLQAGLIELLLWVQVLHSLDLPGRRDVLFSLGTSGALLVVSATLATTNDFGVTALLWFAAALDALVIANLDDAGVTKRRARYARSIPTTLLASVTVGALLFAVLPPARVFSFGLPSRAASGGVSTGGRLVNPSFNAGLPSAAGRGGRTGTFGYFGYMENLDLGFRGRPDDTVVMRVRAPGPDFWRAQTFDTYDGQRWTNSDTQTHRIFGGNALRPVTPPEDRPMLAGDEFIQTFYIAKIAPNMVFAAATPTQVFWPFDEAYELSDGTLRGGDTLSPGTVYSVISNRLRVTADALRTADPRRGFVDADTYTRYTALPPVAPRVRALAEELDGRATNTYDAIQAMTDWIATHTKYSLNPPRLHPADDAVDRFLFEDQRGFCEQIASSLVVMLRSVGVPARLTVGYASGHRNPFTGLYEVRASDAHAYTEVLFPGVGWQAFDPTADVPLAGDSGAFPRFAGAGLAKWVSERLPTPAQMVLCAVAALVIGAAGAFVVHLRRLRKRTWLDVQLHRLQQRAGIPIDASSTLPRWLAGLPPDQRDELEPVVRALEHEAWSADHLHEEDRRWVEKKLEKVR